jgi:hypothetical protein
MQLGADRSHERCLFTRRFAIVLALDTQGFDDFRLECQVHAQAIGQRRIARSVHRAQRLTAVSRLMPCSLW